MPIRLLSFFIAYFTGEKGGILKKYNHGEEEEKHLQNEIERGEAIIQNINEIDGAGEQKHGKEWICKNHLPEELVIESILTKLPARSLAVSSSVSKLWYNTILNDSRFAAIHHIQNKDKVFLVFNLLNNVSRCGSEMVYFFSFFRGKKQACTRTKFLTGLRGKKQACARIKFLTGYETKNTHELVGFCNGLACTKLVAMDNDAHGSITVVNPIWNETLVLSYFPPTVGYIYLCHGFGFDLLSQVYKAVVIFASEANNELLCMVITLGTMSWRKIITSTFDISTTRVPRTLWRPATFCGGDLYWRTQNQVGNNDDKIEMLLSFDLHTEKIHFIRLPAESTPTTTTTECRYLVVDHLLEYKGHPCVARSEGITTSHCGHRCDNQTGVCCCCYKVNMYILKDKDKQVWTREETFDVQIMDQEDVLPTPLCGYFGTSAPTPPTRILSFSNQVLLYWFNGEHLIFYNLQEKHLEVVECSRSYPSVFRAKMNEDLKRRIGDDDNIYCPSMDYQLHAQVENIISLKTFIPKGAITMDTADEVKRFLVNNPAAGWLMTGKPKNSYYVFS